MESLNASEVKHSLLTYMTTLGVDDWLFIINLEVALLMTMLLKMRWWALLALGMHFVLVLVTRMSPRLLECYVQHLRQGHRYWPAASPLQSRGLPPKEAGFLQRPGSQP